MAWTVRIADSAAKQIRKLDRQTADRILTFLNSRVAQLDDPRAIGDALQGKELGSYWKYRVGDWRIIADIEDRIVTVTVVRIGDRREIYRR